MKHGSWIIKTALGVSAAAAVFSLVTLLRALYLHLNMIFPIIQFVGSLAVFAVCFLMNRSLKAAEDDNEEEDASNSEDDEIDGDREKAGGSEAENDQQMIDELEEKYHLSDFEK